MKKSFLFALFCVASLVISCTKDVPCYDVTFEISGPNTTVDTIDFRLAGSGASYSDPDESRFFTNISIPFSDMVRLCKEDFDYNLRVYDIDSTLSLTVKVFSNGKLVKQKTGKPDPFLEVAGGINE